MKKQYVQILLLFLLLLAMAVTWRYGGNLQPAALEGGLRGLGWAMPLLFMLLYILATVLLLPSVLVTMAGGALFGPVWGTLYSLTAASLGAGIAFLLSRYLLRDWVQARTRGMLKSLMQGVADEGWRFVAFTRLVPLFPFSLLNYAFGLTQLPFWTFIVASWLFMLPGTAVYTYLGYVGKEAAGGGEHVMHQGLLALALLALLLFVPRWINKWRGRSLASHKG
ncbi:conserved hypothetical protein [Magnetococcus marinus MC-1]|uniref:TVP38/TMEM64 family membrane protein n=1 Tax=Magnetococcus marinus (strain ATCC BAA-1437 / JCM 17883 / MC-1) TaxID=156889 RepID=A0L664_MAGMM|nr:TVP38/TMEM64 family protein [Magnetococcus marinus]ABK43457.1 conserved hypothetical protein [Magnetococcus marinus MC-1]